MSQNNEAGREVRSVQLWPEGKMVYVSGDPRGELFTHADRDDKAGRVATDDERRRVLVETIAGELAERDILVDDSGLVSELMKLQYEGRGDLAEAFSDENVSNLRPDPDDWTLEECRGWLNDNGHDLPDPNPWAMDRDTLLDSIHNGDDGEEYEQFKNADRDTLLAQLIEDIGGEYVGGLDDWRDAVRDNAEGCEIFQWFRVTPYLANRLTEIGQPVLDNDYGEWWGRTCCGQSVLMDGTIQRVADLIAK